MYFLGSGLLNFDSSIKTGKCETDINPITAMYKIIQYLYDYSKILLAVIFILNAIHVFGQNEMEIIVKPAEYPGALRNPLKGFTTTNVSDHPWGSLTHSYIRWNEIENTESDGIDKIISVCNQKWKNAAAKNMKVIPRVYLHWDGEQKYWPADMQTDDYTSAQFQARVLRLVKRLGLCWDNDPRVAYIELGIFGKWGEHHSPSPTMAMQKLVGDAFAKAFKNKKVSVRQNWEHFTDQPFGEYWDSWAHYEQMWGHGNSINGVNEKTGRYKETYIGGEVAYNWGNWTVQPGATPTISVAVKNNRDFVINSIRWLHCTQLKWIGNYDKYNAEAVKGAEEMQKAFGYRYLLNEVRFSLSDSLKISFDVTNTGSAPFYYNWPVEIALLDSLSHQPIWKAKMDKVDIRDWLPGESWTNPEWNYVGSWQEYLPNETWNSSGITGWSVPPLVYTEEDHFKIDSLKGTYILTLAILDPAGNLPVVKLATKNYLKGGRHPVGIVNFNKKQCNPLPADFLFDNPGLDNSLYYSDKMGEIIDTTDVTYLQPVRNPYNNKYHQFPGDSLLAWQYDYFQSPNADTLFSRDTAISIGIYGCNDTTGINVRSYDDINQAKHSAQFKWNSTSQTFQKNGQWLEYSVDFTIDEPCQLLLRARNNVDANFKLTISNLQGNIVFSRDINLKNDFTNLGGGNDQTDWFLSTFPVSDLWGTYIARFDWYDNLGEPGIFGSFSFINSTLDFTPPEWYYVSIGSIELGTDIVAMTNETATVYLVPSDTTPDTSSILLSAVASVNVTAYAQGKINTSALNPGDYVVYALDSANNISKASRLITLETPVSVHSILFDSEVTVQYNPVYKSIKIKSTSELKQVDIYNILGKKVGSKICDGTAYNFPANGLTPGVYLMRIYYKSGSFNVAKVLIQKQNY